jgi:hypothetical protein
MTKKQLTKISFLNGLSFEVGGPCPELTGKVIFIWRHIAGYEIGCQDGEEGYSYYYDYDGNQVDKMF